MPDLMSIPQSLEYQKQRVGRIVFGREALYKIAHNPQGKRVVWVGAKKCFFPKSTIDDLLGLSELPRAA
jgi:hypothetical protein